MKNSVAQMALDVLNLLDSTLKFTDWENGDGDEIGTQMRALVTALKQEIAQPVEVKQDFWTTWDQLESESDEHIGQALASNPDLSKRLYQIIEADALYAAPQEPAAPAWMPIETAPKDGSSYLIWAGGAGMAHWVARYHSGYPYNAPFSENLAAWKGIATHWMPLPVAPGSAT